MPFVSSASIVDTAKIDGTENSAVSAEIYISCSASEISSTGKYIHNAFGDAGKIVKILGDFDLRLSLTGVKSLQDLAAKVKRCHDREDVHTLTQVSFGSDCSSGTTGGELVVRVKKSRQEIVGNRLVARGVRVESLLAKFRWISKRIHSSLGNSLGFLAHSDLIKFQEKVFDLLNKEENSASAFVEEDCINALIEAYMQRDGYRSLPSFDHDLAVTDLAFGPHLPLKALDIYISALHRYAFSRFTPEGQEEWKLAPTSEHLVIANKSRGFQVLPNSVYQVPYDVLLAPCKEHMTWQTLSHELCHIITTEFMVSDGFSDAIEQLAVTICAKSPKGLEIEVVRRTSFSDMREIVAHYLDFKIFFNKDFENYLTSIWSTWRYLSKNMKNDQRYTMYRQYLQRCFAVYLMFFELSTIQELAKLDFEDGSSWIPAAREKLNHIGTKFKYKIKLIIADDRANNILFHESFDSIILGIARLAPLINFYLISLTKVISNTPHPETPTELECACSDLGLGIAKTDLESSKIVNMVLNYHLALILRRENISASVKSQLAMLFSIVGASV